MKKLSTLTLLAAGLAAPAFAQTVITDADLVGGQTYDWDSTETYVLNGYVFLEEGGVLNIPAGTVIKGRAEPDGTAAGDAASALIITRGAQIFATGTAEDPIIFTTELDDLSDATDIENPESARGLWGGLIVLGNATIANAGGESTIEGLSSQEGRGSYGGGTANIDDTESSGQLNYVSIRHGGDIVGTDNEINGLTLGGVGSGTEIDYIEVFANVDDGIEFFGGTVDVKHASIAFCGDDSFDYDQGWRGRGQFWFSINATDESGRGGEFDGATPAAVEPFSNPTIANGTWIGSGAATPAGGDGNEFAIFTDDAAAGKFYNSVFTDFPADFISIEDNIADEGVDVYQRFQDGDITFAGNIIGTFAGDDGTGLSSIVKQNGTETNSDLTIIVDALAATNTYVPDQDLVEGISRASGEKGLNPRPITDGVLLDGGTVAEIDEDDLGADGFFDTVDYVGAFNSTDSVLWNQGWTALTTYGILTDTVIQTSVRELVANGSVRISPNPARESATLEYNLIEPSQVTVGLYDVNGRRIREQASSFQVGPQRSTISTGGLAAGTYFVRIVAGEQTVAKRLTVAPF